MCKPIGVSVMDGLSRLLVMAKGIHICSDLEEKVVGFSTSKNLKMTIYLPILNPPYVRAGL